MSEIFLHTNVFSLKSVNEIRKKTLLWKYAFISSFIMIDINTSRVVHIVPFLREEITKLISKI